VTEAPGAESNSPQSPELALRGIRVLDFTWVGAGALVTQTLAIHGAEVIKVESATHPDNLRVTPPFSPGHENVNGSGYFISRNANKYSFALNMGTDKGRQIARLLLEKSDVVTNNYRPGIMERWGLGYEQARAINPAIVYLAMPMLGSTGPHRDFVGFGSTVAAVAGLTEISGRPDRPPIGTNTHYPDHVPNPGHALVVLLAALYRRKLTGEGANIELAQLESTVNIIGPEVLAASAGIPVTRSGNRVADAAPHGVFRCAGEDTWCAIAVRTDAQWDGLRKVLDTQQVLGAPRFAAAGERKASEAELERLISRYTVTWERNELARALQGAGVPAYPVQSVADLMTDEQLQARGFWHHLEHAEVGRYVTGALPFRWKGGPFAPTRPAPLLGEHTWEVAHRVLGLSRNDYDALCAEGVLQ
jgi:benzylsuccinate CoA-transferase BbsF subunit